MNTVLHPHQEARDHQSDVPSLNILLSAYSCNPYIGSESGVGWKFAMKLSEQHNVTVLTRAVQRPDVEDYFQKNPQPEGLKFVYFDFPAWTQRFWEVATPSEHIHYFFWQRAIRAKAKQILKTQKIDLIHHITLGVFRTPSFLGGLGKPFIFGPVGGGESIPKKLQQGFAKENKRTEFLRDTVNKLSVYNPLLNRTFKESSLILCKTQETMRWVPQRFQDKCDVKMEIGLNQEFERPAERKSDPDQPLKILYVGRTIYWKGLPLALSAYAKLVEVYPEAEFAVIGVGGEDEWMRGYMEERGIWGKVQLIPRVAQEELFNMYRSYDLMLFPSMRDSSGNVVLEALAHGIPVMCLDLNGPMQIVDEKSSVIVSTDNRTVEEVEDALFQELKHLYENRARLDQLRANAVPRANYFTIDKVVSRVYESYFSTRA